MHNQSGFEIKLFPPQNVKPSFQRTFILRQQPSFYTFWEFLQLPVFEQITHLALKWLRWQKAIELEIKETPATIQYEQIKMERDILQTVVSVADKIYAASNKRPDAILIGRDFYPQVKYEFQFSFPYVNGTLREFYGMKIVFLPYMQGILPINLKSIIED
jgi:hypothetical protein